MLRPPEKVGYAFSCDICWIAPSPMCTALNTASSHAAEHVARGISRQSRHLATPIDYNPPIKSPEP